MLTRWDKIIFSAVLLVAAVAYILFAFFTFGEYAETVSIFVNGEEYATYSLSEISDSKIVEIETEFGHNTLEITNSGARITEASCPDKTDIQSGKITKPGQMLVCVPNRVAVRIFGKRKASVDRVTY